MLHPGSCLGMVFRITETRYLLMRFFVSVEQLHKHNKNRKLNMCDFFVVGHQFVACIFLLRQCSFSSNTGFTGIFAVSWSLFGKNCSAVFFCCTAVSRFLQRSCLLSFIALFFHTRIPGLASTGFREEEEEVG